MTASNRQCCQPSTLLQIERDRKLRSPRRVVLVLGGIIGLNSEMRIDYTHHGLASWHVHPLEPPNSAITSIHHPPSLMSCLVLNPKLRCVRHISSELAIHLLEPLSPPHFCANESCSCSSHALQWISCNPRPLILTRNNYGQSRSSSAPATQWMGLFQQWPKLRRIILPT